jgi:hypothetical protein
MVRTLLPDLLNALQNGSSNNRSAATKSLAAACEDAAMLQQFCCPGGWLCCCCCYACVCWGHSSRACMHTLFAHMLELLHRKHDRAQFAVYPLKIA